MRRPRVLAQHEINTRQAISLSHNTQTSSSHFRSALARLFTKRKLPQTANVQTVEAVLPGRGRIRRPKRIG
jgi:hypothetical protein